ncbi:MAG TPA: tryptophan synthase subunit alpha [Candidatus Aquicultor sp.]|jgi:tryptophan synthase alpha chain
MLMKTNAIDDLFEQLRAGNKAALMPYLMAGFPNIEASLKLITGVAEAGADLIELGIPYSDPLADGPTIQAAAECALANGVTTDTAFELVRRARQHTATPIVIMTYYNIIYRYGMKRFAINAGEAGVNGVICPDLPPEEADPWRHTAATYGIATVMLATPTSGEDRLRNIARMSSGFIYCVSLTGVTGARANLPANLADFIKRIRKVTDKPLAVGFGISQPEQAKQIAGIADGVIIGSALISLIGNAGETCVETAVSYISEIRAVMDS